MTTDDTDLKPSVFPEDGAPARKAFICDVYPVIADAEAYAHAMAFIDGPGQPREDDYDYARHAIEAAKPRDAIERMLVAQVLFAHARVARLTLLANQQDSLESIQTINGYADKASNTARRLALALKELRAAPPAASVQQTIHQANIADQQIVINREVKQSGANEQGSDRPGHSEGPETALPPDARGIGVATGFGSRDPALEPLDRAQDI